MVRGVLLAGGAICFAAMSGCDGVATNGKYADSPTPVKYVICKQGYIDCFLSARFTDRRNCELYKEVNGWHCDTASIPGKSVCEPGDTTFAVAYCTD